MNKFFFPNLELSPIIRHIFCLAGKLRIFAHNLDVQEYGAERNFEIREVATEIRAFKGDDRFGSF